MYTKKKTKQVSAAAKKAIDSSYGDSTDVCVFSMVILIHVVTRV